MAEKHPIDFFRYNEQSLLIQWPKVVSISILQELTALRELITKKFPESLSTPTYASMLLVFPYKIIDFENICQQIQDLHQQTTPINFKGKHIAIPVCYEEAFALDKTYLEEKLQLDFNSIVRLHTAPNYQIYGIGFLPGFMYLGGLDSRLIVPRKGSPRMQVPKGSVGIAAGQTGVYPQESPGGWQIIGNCPLEFFKANEQPPFFAEVGDTISFVSISLDQYKLIQIEQKAGVYQLKTSQKNPNDL